MENIDIARIFSEIADLLEIKGENPFRVRSYRNAALVIEGLPITLETIVERDEKELEEIPGIGKSLHEKIVEILKTGKCSFHQDLLKEMPPGLLDLLRIQGLGPKKVKALYEKLGIQSVEELEKEAAAGRLRSLPGMGERTEENIIKSIRSLRESAGRFGIALARSYAGQIVEYLREMPGVSEAVPAGSLRRWKETVGDVDILVTCREGTPVMDRFVSFPQVDRVLAKGKTKTTVVLGCGLQVDVRVLEERSFGAALQYFTGSKAHNIAVRDRAKRRGLKISEYGVFRESDGKRIAGRSEEEVYEAVGLCWIPPELRENRGEIEAAEKGELPLLVEKDDIRGDLHLHTKYSDGGFTVEEMARHAMSMGYEYMAVTDHSKAVGIAHGLDEERLLTQMEEIDRLNMKLEKEQSRFRILKGVELDIRGDGSLDLDMDVLKRLDIVVAAIHSRFNMPEEEMTGRIIRALSTGIVNVLAHPTGRLINRRAPYQVNMAEVLEAAGEYGVAMEINAYPDRLDLSDVHCRLAKDKGVKVVISTDSHSKLQMEYMRYGIQTARRGWLGKADVLNTKSLDELLDFLGGGR